jgi:hypothetical protein
MSPHDLVKGAQRNMKTYPLERSYGHQGKGHRGTPKEGQRKPTVDVSVFGGSEGAPDWRIPYIGNGQLTVEIGIPCRRPSGIHPLTRPDIQPFSAPCFHRNVIDFQIYFLNRNGA